MNPKKHKKQLEEADKDLELYESDIINYDHLMIYSKDLKQAVYIGSLKTNKEGRGKLSKINDQHADHRIVELLELAKN